MTLLPTLMMYVPPFSESIRSSISAERSKSLEYEGAFMPWSSNMAAAKPAAVRYVPLISVWRDMIQTIIESQKEYGLPTFPEFISASSFRNSGIQFPTEADSLENSTGARLFARKVW